MFCNSCGTEVSGGKFCPECGAPLYSPEPLPKLVEQNAYRPMPQYKPMPQAQAIPLSKKQRIASNKANGIACCPKCGSTSISANRRGWKITTGILGSSKIIATCLNCGHKWKP